VDVPSELIREQVNEEAKLEDSLRAFDPLVGDLLAPFHVFDSSKRPWGFIAFPMGESGCDLSEDISHLLTRRRRINATIDFSNLEFSADGRIITEPSHYPAMKFETPICQIVSSPTSSTFSKGTFPYFDKEVCHAEQKPCWALGHSHRPHCYHCPCQRPSRARGLLLLRSRTLTLSTPRN